MQAELTTHERRYRGERSSCIRLKVNSDTYEAVLGWLLDVGFDVNTYKSRGYIYVFPPKEE